MGLLAELFVATAEEAKTYDGSSAHRFRSVQLGGLTNLEFETLWAILAGQGWSPKTHSLEQVASTDGTWTFGFPMPFLDLLRELSMPAASAAAQSWAATEELACAPGDVEPVIAQLTQLARSADGQRGLFLWTSL